jgi:hypothetical protein
VRGKASRSSAGVTNRLTAGEDQTSDDSGSERPLQLGAVTGGTRIVPAPTRAAARGVTLPERLSLLEPQRFWVDEDARLGRAPSNPAWRSTKRWYRSDLASPADNRHRNQDSALVGSDDGTGDAAVAQVVVQLESQSKRATQGLQRCDRSREKARIAK